MKWIIATLLLVFVVIAGCSSTEQASTNTGQNTQTAPQTDAQGETQNSQEQETITSTNQQQGINSQELAIHNSKTNCWVGYKGKVYDVTAWLKKHPGGENAIARYCGTSSEFETGFEKQHRTSKVNVLEQEGIYKGELI